jgi:hypothetical protein
MIQAVLQEEIMGQTRIAGQDRLPLDMNGIPRAAIESLGFVFGAPIDDLFVAVTFPPGWTTRADGQALYTHLIDAQGHKRATVFYKAALYDRRADMDWLTRFRVNGYSGCDAQGVPDPSHEATHVQVNVTDRGQSMRTFGAWAARDPARFPIADACREEARAWLTDEHPDWKNPLAYWDEA